MDNFIMLKNKLVRGVKEDSLTKKLNNKKLISIVAVLDQCVNRMNKCYFTIDELCSLIGIIPKRGEGKSIEQIRMILIALKSEGYLKDINVDLLKVKSTEMIKCTYSNEISKDSKEMFFKLQIDKFNELLSLGFDEMLFYCYIKSIMGNNDKYCYPKIEAIEKDTTLSDKSIKSIVEKLTKNNLLYSANIGQYILDGKTHTANNVYVLDKKDLEMALEGSKNHYENELGAKLLNKKQSKKTQELNMLKNIVKRELAKGKDVSDKIKNKIEKLESELDYSCKYSRTEALDRIDEIISDYDLSVSAGDLSRELQVSVFTAKGCNEILDYLESIKDTDDMKQYFNEWEEESDTVSKVSEESIWGEPYKEIEDNKVIPMPKERVIVPKKVAKSSDFEKKQQNINDLKMAQYWEDRNIQGLIEGNIIRFNDCVSSNKKIDMNIYVDNFKKIKSTNELEETLKEFIRIVNAKEQEHKEEMEDLEALL